MFSHTLESVRGPRTHLVRDDAAEFVRTLRTQPGKRIGGGVLTQYRVVG